MRLFRVVFLMAIAAVILNCSSPSPTETPSALAPADTSYDTIFIVDATGEKWDITYAVDVLGMDSARFGNGVGKNLFIPFEEPDFLQAGDPGFPASNARLAVIGVNIDGDKRAYPPNDLIGHEVVDDVFGDKYIAVGY